MFPASDDVLPIPGGTDMNGYVIDESGAYRGFGDFAFQANMWNVIELSIVSGSYPSIGFNIVVGANWFGTLFFDDIQIR